MPFRGDQAGFIASRRPPVANLWPGHPHSELFRQRDRDHVYARRRCLSCIAGPGIAGHRCEKPDCCGALPDIVEDQFRRLFDQIGIGAVSFLPSGKADELPPVGKNTRYLLAQPFLNDTARCLKIAGRCGSRLLFRSAPRERPPGFRLRGKRLASHAILWRRKSPCRKPAPTRHLSGIDNTSPASRFSFFRTPSWRCPSHDSYPQNWG